MKKELFKDIIAYDDTKKTLKRLVDVLNNKEKYKRIGSTIPHGLLLYGPPGLGKTTIAKEIINEINSVINKNRILLNQGIVFIPYLIHLKYLCEENIYSFDEVIANDQLYPLTKESLRFIKHNSNTKTPINRILLSIKHMSSKEILLEYLEYLDKHLYLHDVNDNIAIINTDNIEDKSKLLSIIKNNRKQKDVLIKITLQDLRDNNYRIGFNLYNLEKANKIKDINKIVDENTYYLERLNRINQTVEEEINRLLNR